MKVKVDFTFDLDAEAWRLNFPDDTTAEAVRVAVRAQAEESLADYLHSIGVPFSWRRAL